MKNSPASKVFILSFMFLFVTGTLLLTTLFERINAQQRERAVSFLETAQTYADLLGYSEQATPLFRSLRKKIILSERGKDLLLAYKDAYVFLLYITVIRAFQLSLLLFSGIVLVGTFRWIRAVRPELVWKFQAWKIRRTQGLSGSPVDKAISYLIALIEYTDVPASIGHHESKTGGLRAHTWRVVQNALRLYREEYRELYGRFHHFPGVPPEKIIYLLALAHDAGKVRLYRKRRDQTYQTLRIPELSQTKILVSEVLRRSGMPAAHIHALVQCLDPQANLPKELQALREIIHRADRSAVSVELGGEEIVKEEKALPTQEPMEVKRPEESVLIRDLLEDSRTHRLVLEAYFEVLKELNVNGIRGQDYDGWYDPEKDLLAINVWKVAQRVTLYLQRYTDHPLSRFLPRAGSQKLHPIVPVMTKVLEKAGILRTEFNGIFAERGLFNIRAGSVKFNAVYLIKTETVPPDLLRRWADPSQALNIYPVRVLARSVFTE